MGMYTELNLNVSLKEDTPSEVVYILEYMLDNDKVKPTLPEHPLFGTERWDWMLQCDSYYFDADTHSTLRYDDIARQYYLNIQCNFKNYGGELKKFIDWITPYVDTSGFWGYECYEECDYPTMIYDGEFKDFEGEINKC